jgi:hypothetical protein
VRPLDLDVRAHVAVAHLALAYRSGRAVSRAPLGITIRTGRDFAVAAQLLTFGYPAWFLLSLIWLLPGIALSRRFALSPLWVVPTTAVIIQITVEAISHWPPTRWPLVVTWGHPPLQTTFMHYPTVSACVCDFVSSRVGVNAP